MAANKYESRPAPARSYTPPPRPSSNTRQQEYKRQDRQNDNRRQDIYRAQQNRVVTDELKKKKH